MTIHKVKVVKTHIPELDQALLGGPAAGDLIVVAGEAGVGKSYFAEQILQKCHGGTRIAYVTTEDPPALMSIRMLARHAHIAPAEIRQLPEDAFAHLASAHEGALSIPRVVSARGTDCWSLTANLDQTAEFDVVIVDCLQGLRPDGLGLHMEQMSRAVLHLRCWAANAGAVMYLTTRIHGFASELKHEVPGFEAADVVLRLEAQRSTHGWKARVSLEKSKWQRRLASFLVDRDPVTGCFGSWVDERERL